MDTQGLLLRLKQEVAEIRNNNSRLIYPSSIRAKALLLVGKVGIGEVARETGLSVPTLYSWRSRCEEAEVEFESIEPVSLEITRVCVGNRVQHGEAPLAMLQTKVGNLSLLTVEAVSTVIESFLRRC
jgi:hypothetical protein